MSCESFEEQNGGIIWCFMSQIKIETILDGFMETFWPRFLTELPFSSCGNFSAEWTSSWASLILVSSLTGGSFCATVARQTTSPPTSTSNGKPSPSLYCHLHSSSFLSPHFTCDQHLRSRQHAQQPFLEVSPPLFLSHCRAFCPCMVV